MTGSLVPVCWIPCCCCCWVVWCVVCRLVFVIILRLTKRFNNGGRSINSGGNHLSDTMLRCILESKSTWVWVDVKNQSELLLLVWCIGILGAPRRRHECLFLCRNNFWQEKRFSTSDTCWLQHNRRCGVHASARHSMLFESSNSTKSQVSSVRRS